MPEHQSNLDLPAVAELIHNTDATIFITTHTKPDGDAFGSVVALAWALQKMGKQTFACFAPPVAASLQDLNGHGLTHTLHDGLVIPECALYIVVDTGAWSQVEPVRKTLEPNLARTLIIDHHLSGDIDAAHKYIDAKAGACAEIIAELLDLLDGAGSNSGGDKSRGWDATIAQALFAGIGTDTGWFRFSNTRPQTHRLAARLLELGVDHTDLYARLEQSARPQHISLVQRAMDSLVMDQECRVAVMQITARDFVETKAEVDDVGRIVDLPQVVAGVRVVALLTPYSTQAVKVSLRSKPGPISFNVSDLATHMGGGGHMHAASFRMDTDEHTAKQLVLSMVSQWVADATHSP